MAPEKLFWKAGNLIEQSGRQCWWEGGMRENKVFLQRESLLNFCRTTGMKHLFTLYLLNTNCWKKMVMFLRSPVLFLIDGKVVLPGNLLQITFYGRFCNLMVTKVKGTDGVLREMEDSPVSMLEQKLSLDTSDFDLSVQLDKLLIEDSREGTSTSTPCKQVDHSLSINASIDTMVCEEEISGSTEMQLFGDVAASTPVPETTKLKGGEACIPSEGLLQASQTGASLSSEPFYFISSRTRICFVESRTKEREECNLEPKVTYSSIGGLDHQLKTIREMIELPLKQPGLFRSYGRIDVN